MKPTFTYNSRYSVFLFLLISTANVSPAPITKRQALPPQCQGGGYFIPPDQVVGAEAFDYCQSMGGKLVDVNNQNVVELTAMVSKCIGINRNVRIQTWDTNNFGTYNLVLHTGMQSGAGTVSTSGAGDSLFALCQMAPPDSSFEEDDPSPYFGAPNGGNFQAANYKTNKIQIPEEAESKSGEFLDENGMPIDA